MTLFTRLFAAAGLTSLVVVTMPLAPREVSTPPVQLTTVDLLAGDVAAATVDGTAGPAAAGGAVAPEGWSRTVELDAPGQMVAFEWDGAADGAVRVRAQGPGGWQDPVELHGDPAEGPDTGSPEHRPGVGVGPLWVGDDAEQVEIEVVEGELPNLRMVVVDAPPPSAPDGVAGAAPAQPAGIIPRSAWGAGSWRSDLDGCGTSARPASGGARNIVIHHTVNSNSYSPADAATLVRGIWAYHTQGREYCDIAYNLIVDRYGRIFEGRSGGIAAAVVGAHAAGFNTGSIGVAVLGDHTTAPVPAATREALVRLLTYKSVLHGIDTRGTVSVTAGGGSKFAEGQTVSIGTVVGHRDVGVTSCPGGTLAALIPSLRQQVQGLVVSSRPGAAAFVRQATGPRVVTLDGWGGVHQAGSQGVVEDGPWWPWWDIARDVALDPTGEGGYVLDAWGGVHAFGGTPPAAPGAWWPNQDRARTIVAGPQRGSGWVMDVFGSVVPFGGAAPLATSATWPRFPIARGMAVSASGTGGYVLDGYGGLHPLGDAPRVQTSGYWPGWDIARGIALRPDGRSGYVLDAFGGLHPFGGAPALPVSRYTPGRSTVVDLQLDAEGDGGWTIDREGRLWPIGDAPAARPARTFTGLDLAKAVAVAPGLTV